MWSFTSKKVNEEGSMEERKGGSNEEVCSSLARGQPHTPQRGSLMI